MKIAKTQGQEQQNLLSKRLKHKINVRKERQKMNELLDEVVLILGIGLVLPQIEAISHPQQ
jgi:hypothetical protein